MFRALSLLYFFLALGARADSPLSRWIYDFDIHLPNITTTLAGSLVRLHELKCTNFVANNVDSKFLPPDQLTVDIGKLDLSCNGRYDVDTHIIIIGDVHAQGDFDFTASATLDLDVTIKTNFSSPIPAAASGTCKTKSTVQDLHFHGSGIQSFLIEVLTPLLKPFLPGQVDPIINKEVENLVSKNLTAILDMIDTELEKPVPPALPTPVMPDTIFNLTKMKIFREASESVYNILGPNGSISIDDIVNVLSHGTGVFRLELELEFDGILQTPDLGLSVIVHQVDISGLNSTQLLEVMYPEDSYILATELLTQKIDLVMNITVNVTTSTQPPLVENLLVSLSATNLKLGGDIILGLDSLSLLELTLNEVGQIGCWPKILYSFNVSYIDAAVSLNQITMAANGALESELATLVNDIFRYLLLTDGPYISKSAARIANAAVRPIVNELVGDVIDLELSGCRKYPEEKLFDWEKYPPVTLLSYIDDQLLNTIGDALVPNDTISLNLTFSKTLVLAGVKLFVNINQLDVSGVHNTFYNTSLLDAAAPTMIQSTLGIGNQRPIDVFFDLTFSINDGPLTRFLINTTVHDLHFALLQDLTIENSFLNTTVLEYLETHPLDTMNDPTAAEGVCFLANYVDVWNFTITSLQLDDAMVALNFDNSWTSLEDLIKKLSPTLWSIVGNLKGQIPETISSSVNSGIQQEMVNAPYYCAGQIPPLPASGQDHGLASWTLLFMVVAGTWAFVFGIGCLGWKIYSKRQADDYSEAMTPMETKTNAELVEELPWSSIRQYYPLQPDGTARSWAHQLLVPGLILAAVAIKIFALVVRVTRVRMEFEQPDGMDVLDSYIIDFNFGNMVRYFWKSGAYLISLLIVAGSCVMPFLIQMSLLAAWFIPMKPSFRGRMLMLFTQVGKGSYIDVMFLCYIVLVMKQEINIAGWDVKITAEPVEGLFGGIASTTATLFATHWLWHIHNSQLEPKHHPSKKRRSLWGLHIRRMRRRGQNYNPNNRIRSWIHYVSLVVLFLMAAVSLFAVIYRDDVTWFKLTGVLAELPGPSQYEIIRTYKVYSFPKDLPKNTDEVAGAYTIAVAYSILVLALPLAILALWLVLWLVPLKKNIQRNLYTAMNRVWSFCGLEVFWIASFAAVLEINQVAVWILGHTLQGWCEQAGSLQSFCVLIEPISTNGKLLHIDAKFVNGAWWLLSQIILYYCLYNATLYYGGMLLGHTSRNGWTQPPSRPSSYLSGPSPKSGSGGWEAAPLKQAEQ
mmetsp:Transcript_29129/g.49389  ORF Transcript_29129/g.49389 Transcript_29129/m.49389 type:complete len:1251 (+) Transcript_29129:148-3900(+)